MKKIAPLALAVLLSATLAPAARTDTPKLALVRVHVDSPAEAAWLMSNFDETHNHAEREIELLLWPGDRVELDATDFTYDVVTEDLVARDLALNSGPKVRQSLPGPDYDDYRRLPDYLREMEEIAKKNPKIVKRFKLKRPSLEGRDIFGLEIAANVKRKDGRPTFYMDGLHHAREWPSSEFTVMFAHYLTERFGKDKKVTSLMKRGRVILVPIVNPDGFNYSRESVTSIAQPARDATFGLGYAGLEGYWRKNRRSLTGVTVPGAQVNPEAHGVDPNRNYGYMWGDQQGGSSSNPADQTYRGEAPFSEPEAANVRDIIMSHPVTGIITNHTVQATVLRTGGGEAPDDRDLNRIGEKLATILNFRNNASVGYPTTGTTDDWAYGAMGAYGFTVEHGGSGFHCAYATCVGTPTNRTMKAFLKMFEYATTPKFHSVLKGRVANGRAKLTIDKSFKTPLSSGNPLGKKSITEKLRWSINTGKDGSFVWHLTPSKRPYVRKAETYKLTISVGGKTRTMNVQVKRGQSLSLGTIRV